MGMGLGGSIIFKNRRPRWLLKLFKNKQEIGTAHYIKVYKRPEVELSSTSMLPDLDHRYEYKFSYYTNSDNAEEEWTQEYFENMDEGILSIINGSGQTVETWVLGDIKNVIVAIAADENAVFDVTMECATHSYEAFPVG